MELFVFGLFNTAILAISALGFSLTFGVSGIANFAYGGFFILGAFLCWGLLAYSGLPYWACMAISLITIAALGFAVYWTILFRVRGLILAEVIATFGIGIAILEILRWRRFVGKHYVLPSFVDGSVNIFGIFIDWHRITIIGLAFLLVILIWLFTHHTKIGLAFRGIAQEEYTALSVGIRNDLVAALSMAIGSALAVMAAIAILPLGNINIERGYDILIYALAVGIVGGLESIAGVLVASIILGYAQTAASLYIGSHWVMIVLLGGIIVILALKPSGLFGKSKELEERV